MNNCKALKDTSIVSFTIHGILCSRFVELFWQQFPTLFQLSYILFFLCFFQYFTTCKEGKYARKARKARTLPLRMLNSD
jgi:hypothetical protein